MEKFEEQQPVKNVEHEKRNRLAKATGLMIDTLFNASIGNSTNLEEVKKLKVEGKRIIFLPTHMSDFDVPIAIAKLGETFGNISVAEAEDHQFFTKNPTGYIGRKIAGEENSFLVGFTGGRGWGHGVFKTEDYIPMKRSLESGRPLVIAAYHDTNYNDHTWSLPDKGGNGGVFLSEITENAVLVPVAIDIESSKDFAMGDANILQLVKEMRPKVNVKIGKPITPEPIKDINKFRQVLEKRKNGEKISEEDRQEFSRIHKEIKKQSDKVMKSIADMLPDKKKGKWMNLIKEEDPQLSLQQKSQ